MCFQEVVLEIVNISAQRADFPKEFHVVAFGFRELLVFQMQDKEDNKQPLTNSYIYEGLLNTEGNETVSYDTKI